MPSNEESIRVVITGDDQLGGTATSVRAHIDGLRDSFDGLDHVLSFVGEVAANLVASAIQNLGQVIGDVASKMIGSNAQFEQYTTQFQVLLGSTEAAQQRMADLAEFGAKTPFDLPGVVEADRILQGFGLHAADVAEEFGFSGEQIRTIAGDVAAGTGSSFQEMATLIGRFSAGATGEAISRMQELGIATRKQLAEMGLEFSNSGQLLSPLPEAMDVLLTAMQDKYGGLMDAQSSTFEGMMSNMRDWIDNTLRMMGQPIFNVLKEQLGGVLEILGSEDVQNSLQRVAEAVGLLVERFAELATPFLEDALKNLPNTLNSIADAVINFVTWVDTAIATVSEFLAPIVAWISQNVELQDVIGTVVSVITASLIPVLITIAETVAPIILLFAAVIGAVVLLRQAWESDFGGIRSAVEDFWAKLQPVFATIKEWFERDIPPILNLFRQIWTDELAPAIDHFVEVVVTQLLPLIGVELPDDMSFLEGLLRAVTIVLGLIAGAMSRFADTLNTGAYALQRITSMVNGLKYALSNLQLPDWLIPGSPTPFELGLRGISDAMETLSGYSLPSLSTQLGVIGGGNNASGGTVTNYALTVNTNAKAESAISDFGLMRSLAGL